MLRNPGSLPFSWTALSLSEEETERKGEIRIEPQGAAWTRNRSWLKVSERKYTSAVILSSSWRQTVLKQLPKKKEIPTWTRIHVFFILDWSIFMIRNNYLLHKNQAKTLISDLWPVTCVGGWRVAGDISTTHSLPLDTFVKINCRDSVMSNRHMDLYSFVFHLLLCTSVCAQV